MLPAPTIAAAAVLATKAASTAKANPAVTYVILVGLALVVWFFFRSRSQTANRQRSMLMALEPGEEVMTGAGIIGTVEEVTGDRVVLRTGVGHTLTVLRST